MLLPTKIIHNHKMETENLRSKLIDLFKLDQQLDMLNSNLRILRRCTKNHDIDENDTKAILENILSTKPVDKNEDPIENFKNVIPIMVSITQQIIENYGLEPAPVDFSYYICICDSTICKGCDSGITSYAYDMQILEKLLCDTDSALHMIRSLEDKIAPLVEEYAKALHIIEFVDALFF